jgi:DNA-binding beta-propeller fold protein YncE
MNNGITTDGKFVYVADTFAKTIKRYVRLPDNKLQYNLTIQLESGPDNIEYDPDRKKIVITTIEKQLDFLSVTQQ